MKQKISIAAERPTPKDLSRNHYTTLGFGNIFPIFAEEPGLKIRVDIGRVNWLKSGRTFRVVIEELNIDF